jgi:hypothetical protein
MTKPPLACDAAPNELKACPYCAEPIRQWVLSFPFQLRFLFASYPHIMGKVLGIVYRTLATHITKKAGYNKQTAKRER